MKNLVRYGCILIGILWLLVSPFINSQKQYDIETYKETIEATIDVETMPLQDQKFIRRFYQLHQEDYEQAIVYAKQSTMDVEEIAIIQGKDAAQCDAIEQQLLTRIEKQKQIFAGYGIDQIEILNQAQLFRNKNTVILLVSNDLTLVREAIKQME